MSPEKAHTADGLPAEADHHPNAQERTSSRRLPIYWEKDVEDLMSKLRGLWSPLPFGVKSYICPSGLSFMRMRAVDQERLLHSYRHKHGLSYKPFSIRDYTRAEA